MNNIMYLKKKRAFKGYEFCIQYFILKIFMTLNLVTAYKFAFNSYKNENSEILFFLQRQENRENSEHNIEKFDLKLYSTNEENQFDRQDLVFTYTKENFIEFYLLNNMLLTNSFENNCQNKIINCNFDLSYYLKLSKDFTEIPDRITICQLKYFLLTLKFLQAVDNKNMAKLLQALIFKVFICSNTDDTDKNDTKHEEIIDSYFVSQFDFYIKRGLLIAFLHILMIKYTFYDENLILLEKSKDTYNSSYFNEHIPYKHLLINKYKIFRTLKNTLKSLPNFLCIFQNLLEEINIKSLIITDYEELENRIDDIYLFINSLTFFKSIVISNPNKYSQGFLYDPNLIYKKDIEYLSLKYLTVELSNFVFLLEQQKLKGLILYYVDLEDNEDYSMEYNMRLNLEYIHFANVEMNFFRWRDFFKFADFGKIILEFDRLLLQENVLSYIGLLNSYKNVLYLEIKFCNLYILRDFHKILNKFKYLQNLKLNRYIDDKNSSLYMFEAIKNMNYLENLTINLPYRGVYNNSDYFFGMQNFKVLCLTGTNLTQEIPNIKIWGNYTFLRTLIINKAIIKVYDLIEILKIESLTKFSILYCDIEPCFNYISVELSGINIKSLDFTATNLDALKNIDILKEFARLETLHLSNCNLKSGWLTQTNQSCNLSLKILHYAFNCLDRTDLNRMKNLEVLEELNLRDCKFYSCGFFELGNDYKFLGSLKYLDLLHVEIKIEDLIFLKSFKNLKSLNLTLSDPDFFTAKNLLFYLPINALSLKECNKKSIFENSYSRYLYEENINLNLNSLSSKSFILIRI
ncbi:hypothetical protein CWI38_0878p0020 [Hamiltosporidium tvaerminnensis]|uniref:Leucine-rich repeat-containing protein n=1 Tax=Hamiltosporidium tvaerminnensis TaxID=1176355 RepID=A0A4Q9LU29_9MICR|nr:hypothetical protein CWI38_0878p0020 [Hamiltosporidium tvaerminnensis]